MAPPTTKKASVLPPNPVAMLPGETPDDWARRVRTQQYEQEKQEQGLTPVSDFESSLPVEPDWRHGRPLSDLSDVEKAKLSTFQAEREGKVERATEKPQYRDTSMMQPASRPLDLNALLKGIPIWQGGGGGSKTVTNAIISPEQGAEYKERTLAATEQEREAQLAKSAIAQSLYRDVAAQQREGASAQAAMWSAHQAQRAQMDARVEAQLADNAKVLEQIKAAHIDPQRIYKGEGGGALRIRHGIGTALGAFGAALARSPNFAQQFVDAQLERDFKSQMLDLQKKEWVYQAGRNMITDFYARTHDLEKSYLLGKQAYLDIAKAQVDALTNSAKSEEAVQNGKILAAQLDRAQVQNEEEIKKLEYRRVTVEHRWGGGSLTPMAIAAGMLKLQSNAKEQGVNLTGGGAGSQIPAKLASETGENIASFKNTVERLNETERHGYGWASYLLSEIIGKRFKGTDAERYEAWRKSEALGLSKILNGGRPTDIDTSRVEGMFPAFGEPGFAEKSAKLQAYVAARLRGSIRALANTGRDTTALMQQARAAGISMDGPAQPPPADSYIFKMPKGK